MNVIKVIQKVLTQPADFFTRVGKGKDNLGFAFKYFALLNLLSTFLGGILYLTVTLPIMNRFLPPVFLGGSVASGVIFTIIGYVVSLGLSFAYAGLLHIWVLIFGGEKGYTKSYELGAYAGTPSMLLGWIPVLGGLVGFVWSLVLLIIGTERVHNISKTKSILMWLIPAVILAIISIGSMVMFIMLLKTVAPY